MKIIKRNGAEEVFDIKKIVIAVTKADSSSEGRSLTDSQIEDIAEFVEFKCNKLNRAVSVEEIQDLVEARSMAYASASGRVSCLDPRRRLSASTYCMSSSPVMVSFWSRYRATSSSRPRFSVRIFLA